MHRLLVIDNYDSFTYNLVQMFMVYPLEVDVRRSDQTNLKAVGDFAPDYLMISPGPRDPAHAGISVALIRAFGASVPLLGVCLGMQCINEAFGGTTIRTAIPMHGKTSRIDHADEFLFQGLSSPLTVARYHSLTVQPSAAHDYPLKITARSVDGVIMGLSHPVWPLHGVQFHPESFLTDQGDRLVKNFLRLGPLKAILS